MNFFSKNSSPCMHLMNNNKSDVKVVEPQGQTFRTKGSAQHKTIANAKYYLIRGLFMQSRTCVSPCICVDIQLR